MLATLPGLIDPHVHLRDFDQVQKEDFYTGTAAAIAGGYTTILDMPNNTTPITTKAALQEKISIAGDKIVCDLGFHFGSLGTNLAEFENIKTMVFGLKLYLNQTTGNFTLDPNLLENVFSLWPKDGGPILVHAEEASVEQIIAVVKKVQKPTHFCHISLASELSAIIKAKDDGYPITCGVTPHHLFLTQDDQEKLGPYGLMKPPLRTKKDQDFLWNNLTNIDVIESDHAPHTKEEKESPADGRPPYGVPGLETTLPMLLTAVHAQKLSMEDVIRLCSTGPAKIFHITQDSETKVIVDTDETYTIKNEDLFTKCKWSPFNGKQVTGKVKQVIIRGIKVFEDGKILVEPGSGHILSK